MKMHKIDRFVKAATVVPLALLIGRYHYDFFICSREPTICICTAWRRWRARSNGCQG